MTSVPTRHPTSSQAATALPAVSERFLGVASSVVRDLLALTQRPGVISFAGGLPAPELFDVDGARAAFESVFAAGGRMAMQYSTTEGDPALRAQVAEMYGARGLPTTPEQVVITTGSQQGLSLLAQSLVDPGAVVLVERPSYLAALQCFALAGARLISVPSAGEGIDLDALDALARAHRPVALYTVPTFHNPTGRTLDRANRIGVVEAAARHGFRVLEDDPYQQLRYSGEPMPSMATMTDDPELVVCTGSLSKILAPGLRVGWVRTTPLSGPLSSLASRPRICTPRPWTRLRRQPIWPRVGWHPPSSGPAVLIAIVGTHCSRDCRRPCPAAVAGTHPTVACSSGLTSRRAWTPPTGCRAPWHTRWRTSPAPPSSRPSRSATRSACRSPPMLPSRFRKAPGDSPPPSRPRSTGSDKTRPRASLAALPSGEGGAMSGTRFFVSRRVTTRAGLRERRVRERTSPSASVVSGAPIRRGRSDE